jgi:hypothetical protein
VGRVGGKNAGGQPRNPNERGASHRTRLIHSHTLGVGAPKGEALVSAHRGYRKPHLPHPSGTALLPLFCGYEVRQEACAPNLLPLQLLFPVGAIFTGKGMGVFVYALYSSLALLFGSGIMDPLFTLQILCVRCR